GWKKGCPKSRAGPGRRACPATTAAAAPAWRSSPRRAGSRPRPGGRSGGPRTRSAAPAGWSRPATAPRRPGRRCPAGSRGWRSSPPRSGTSPSTTDAGGTGWPACAGPAAGWTEWSAPPGASSEGRRLRSPLRSLDGRDGHLVRHGGHGEADRAVGRHVLAGDDDQVADRLLAGDQVESNSLEGQDHDAVQDTVMAWRDAAFTAQ